ncbi:hypothetical protein [Nostoc sp. JL33]|nr:hypothetical protein [Nostoc sp. JL33]
MKKAEGRGQKVAIWCVALRPKARRLWIKGGWHPPDEDPRQIKEF